MGESSVRFKEIDLSDPANPQVGPSINIPGDLIGIQRGSHGVTIVTEDRQWGEMVLEPVGHKL